MSTNGTPATKNIPYACPTRWTESSNSTNRMPATENIPYAWPARWTGSSSSALQDTRSHHKTRKELLVVIEYKHICRNREEEWAVRWFEINTELFRRCKSWKRHNIRKIVVELSQICCRIVAELADLLRRGGCF
jgi:hypothetical protein